MGVIKQLSSLRSALTPSSNYIIYGVKVNRKGEGQFIQRLKFVGFLAKKIMRLGRFGQIEVINPYAPVITVYDEMRQLCLSKLPVDACDGLIPARPLYYPPEYKPTIPWWVLLAGGIVIGKML